MKKGLIVIAAFALVFALATATASAVPYVKGNAPNVAAEQQQTNLQTTATPAPAPANSAKADKACPAMAKNDCACCAAKATHK